VSVEYIPGDTIFHRLDPRVKLLAFLVVTILIVSWSDPLFMGGLFFSICLALKLAGVSWRTTFGIVWALAPVVIVYFVFNVFFKPITDPHVLLELAPGHRAPWNWSVSLEALVWSLAAVFRFCCILVTLRGILLLTPVREIILAMVKLGLPAEFGVALGIGFGYIPVLIDENRKIREAQMARGWEYEFKNPIRRLQALYKMLVPTLMNSMRRGNAIAVAIESKGFGYNIRRRTWYKDLHFGGADRAATIGLIALAITGIVIGGPWLNLAGFELTTKLLLPLLGH